MLKTVQDDPVHEFTPAEIGAIAHLYRGEVYRSTNWRSRLDNTTNWSIVTLGIALSSTYSSKEASGLPLLLIGLLLALFLGLEARRYRFFNVWRARARFMETHWYVPMLNGTGLSDDPGWRTVLANDYQHPQYHISFLRAAGRRLRRSYIWIMGIQTAAYFGKLAVHPVVADNFREMVDRARIGPVPGWFVLSCVVIYTSSWIAIAVTTYWADRSKHGELPSKTGMG